MKTNQMILYFYSETFMQSKLMDCKKGGFDVIGIN